MKDQLKTFPAGIFIVMLQPGIYTLDTVCTARIKGSRFFDPFKPLRARSLSPCAPSERFMKGHRWAPVFVRSFREWRVGGEGWVRASV